MPYISGSPIDAYCENCKADRAHVVLEVEGKQVRSVRCTKCESENHYKAPRNKAKAALMELTKKKKAAAKPKRTRKAQAPSPAVIYAELVGDADLSTAVKYNAKKPLEEGDLINHPQFGIGIVTALTDVQKARVMFPTGERVMVCNRG